MKKELIDELHKLQQKYPDYFIIVFQKDMKDMDLFEK